MAKYGVQETNELGKHAQAYHKIDRSTKVSWTDERLERVTRLRLLSDPGYPEWDVSYCHGVLKDGTPCTVELPFSSLPKKFMLRAIVAYAKRDCVHAKDLGVLSAISTLK